MAQGESARRATGKLAARLTVRAACTRARPPAAAASGQWLLLFARVALHLLARLAESQPFEPAGRLLALVCRLHAMSVLLLVPSGRARVKRQNRPAHTHTIQSNNHHHRHRHHHRDGADLKELASGPSGGPRNRSAHLVANKTAAQRAHYHARPAQLLAERANHNNHGNGAELGQ